MNKNVEIFRDEFNDVVESVQRFAVFVRGAELQEESISTLNVLLDKCTLHKKQAIEDDINDDANAYLAFEFMTKGLIEEFQFYLALKKDDPDVAWDHLINAQSTCTAAMKSHAVAIHLDSYIERLHALEHYFFPQPVFFSTGLVVQESTCNICNAKFGECDHIKGRPYMGKLCSRIITKADIREISVVSDPADKHCRALHYTEGNVERNVFTQRQRKAEPEHAQVQEKRGKID